MTQSCIHAGYRDSDRTTSDDCTEPVPNVPKVVSTFRLQTLDPPTAIISGHDLAAVGIYRAITERGLLPGRDIAVTGGGDHPFGTRWLHNFVPARVPSKSGFAKASGTGLRQEALQKIVPPADF
ncbi:substrate-binding domain-containing protein [Paraburkholderia fungorum]|nr:substrate-binding domain-containing protein [Paraburkholderia fungorum]